MNNSVMGFLWWKTYRGFPSRSCRMLFSFRTAGCEHEVLRSLYVTPRSPPLMSTTRTKTAESMLTDNKCGANKQVRSRCYSAALHIKTSPFKHFTRGQTAVFFSGNISLSVATISIFLRLHQC